MILGRAAPLALRPVVVTRAVAAVTDNIFVIQRRFFDELKAHETDQQRPWVGLPTRTMQLLHFYIIEEEDGSAMFVKNRSAPKIYYDPIEYREFKKEYMN